LLDQRYQRRDQKRALEAARLPDQRSEECGDDDGERACGAADELDEHADAEQPVKTPPVLAVRVSVAVLDHHLVDRQVDERLQQRRRAEDERKAREVLLRELAGGDDGGEEAEQGRAVDAERRRAAAKEKHPLSQYGHSRRPSAAPSIVT